MNNNLFIDFNLSLTLEGNGWSSLRVDLTEVSLDISMPLEIGNSYESLFRCLCELIDGKKESLFTLDCEYGRYQFEFSKVDGQKDMFNVEVNYYYSDYGYSIDEVDLGSVECFQLKKGLLITMFYFELKKLSFLLKSKSHFEEFLLFEKKYKEYISDF